MADVRSVLLSFARADDSGDPYAFHLGHQRYLLLGAGGGTQEAELFWDEALLADLAAIRQPNRPQNVVQRLGEKLRRFLTPAGWPLYEADILEAVRAQSKVVLTLRSAAAEIYALPWELITIKSTGQHIGELPGVMLCYEWPETVSAPAEPRPSGAAGRILFAWSAAGGAVPAAEHLEGIRRACHDGGHPFDGERDIVQNASLQRLALALTAARQTDTPITVLHLLCHGQAAGSGYGLALDGLDSAAAEANATVDAGGLRRLLSAYTGMVRLVVLAACDSGNSGELGNHLGSLAQALHRIGIPKVLASRYPLSVAGSIQLAEVLYRELLNGPGSLEESLLSLRQELFRDNSSLDWASLQLYSRAADGAFQPTGYLRQSPRKEPAVASPAGRRWRSTFAAAAVLFLLGSTAAMVKILRKDSPPPTSPLGPVSRPAIHFAQPVYDPVAVAESRPAAAGSAAKFLEPAMAAKQQLRPLASGLREHIPPPRAEPPQLWKVIIRSEDGNSIRVAKSSQTARLLQRGNQAQADFELTTGTHRVNCTDAVTHKSIDVVIRVGAGEKNETDCFPR